jgi:hypothetical protein
MDARKECAPVVVIAGDVEASIMRGLGAVIINCATT